MKNSIVISKREILSQFVSPVAYFVITGFTLLAGYFFFNLLSIFNIVVDRYKQMPYGMSGRDIPNLNQWVIEGYYQTLLIILVFLTPLLTMRLISEEKRRGTFELLVTSPVSVAEIVLGKFLGAAFTVILMILLAGIFPLLLCFYGNPEAPPIFTGLLGVILCTLAFVSIGMAASSFTESQVVAGISSMVVLLLLYVVHSPAEAVGGSLGEVLKYLSPVIQTRDLITGVITLKGIIYFISLIAFGLFMTARVLDAHRWR
ncbi:MAG TPA: ABC transporter permease [Oligoflexia bacterium]|nr:ABC transporter permease [Oligoflexia bacterium]HMP27423.1 ABC transporter permease [Oligoflexia bacterium]